MKLVLWLTALFAVAVGVSLFAGISQGYAILVFPPYRVELSLNLMVVLTIATLLALYLILRAFGVALALPDRVRHYQRERKLGAARTALRHAIKRTAPGPHMTLNLALNYGSRAELVRAMRSFLREGVQPEDVTEESLAQRLYTAGQPDPDLLIRTSGEQRLSNYLLYQCAYSELYFTPTPWPDFDAAQLRLALEAYAARSRRFGKTQEQIDAH
mgnify:CR=1 FL=1